MASPALLRKHRFRMTKAQLIDQIEELEHCADTIEAPNGATPVRVRAGGRRVSAGEREDLAKFPAENPNPVLRVKPDGSVLYANDAAIAVDGLVKGRNKSKLGSELTKICAEAARTAEAREANFESGDRVFAFSIVPISDEAFINLYGRDITGYKRAEKALRAIDQRYQTIMANVPGIVYQKILRRDGSIHFTYVSEGIRETHGLDPEEVMRDPSVWLAATHPDDLDRLKKSNAESTQKLMNWNLEYRIVARDGSTKWMRGAAHVRRNAGGEVVWDGVVLDVTQEYRARQEMIQAQQASVAAEALLRDAIDNISEGFVVYDSDERLVTCNQKWKDLYGYSDEDVMPGVKYEDLVRLDLDKGVIAGGRDRAESYYKQRLAYRKEEQGEFEVELADGRYILIRERLTSSGGRVGIQADITGRKRAERALRESEERYALAMRAIAEAVYEWNVDTDEFSSPGAFEILGLPLKQVKSRKDFLDRIHPDDRQRYRDAYVALLKGETERLNCDVRYRDSKGNWRGARQHAVAVRGENGRTHRVVGAVGDITELMHREQALRDSREMLSAVVNAVPAMINAKDLKSRYVLMNRYQAELYGTSEDAAIGKTAGDLLGAKYGARARRLDREVLTTGEAKPYFDEDHIDAHGVRRKLLSTKVPLKDKEQQVRGVVTVALDITERKRAEEALLAAKQQAEESGMLLAEKNRMLESLSNQLSKYLSPQVYASIFSGRQAVEITSKRKKLTIFFSDIADFTETTDSLEPEELTDLLNHYLTEMSKVAHEYGATIDKYVGDGITAFFGDPESRGVREDAKACVKMAIAMQRRMQELKTEWLDRGLEKPFQIRIGINTGFCTVGNFGSEDRMDYTINGSEVNLAARLESHAEVGGILLGHQTYSLVKDTVLAQERAALTVKGFAKPVRSYAVVGLYDDLVSKGRVIRRSQDGLVLIVDRDKLSRKDGIDAIKTLEDVLAQLKEGPVR